MTGRNWLIAALAATLAACGGGGGDGGPTLGVPDDGNDGGGGGTPNPSGREFMIEPGANATRDALSAFIQAGPGDVIRFDCGFFAMDTGLVLQNSENVTITGCGRNRTVLSFDNSDTAEGILALNIRGLTIQDLTVTDTPGDGVKVIGSDFVTYRNMRAMWSSANNPVTAANFESAVQIACPAQPLTAINRADYRTSPDNGRYAIYPVLSNNVLIENSEAIGASDAGLYVGQSNDVIIRNSRAAFNVAGYEIENTDRADMHGNLAECNTGGFLIFDLPGLSQYGDGTRVFDNIARNNNTDNFAAGGIVRSVPRGTGALILAYDRVEIFDNEFRDHDTASVIIASHELIGAPGDRRLDMYAEGVHIHDNLMINAGGNPPLPDQTALEGSQDSLLPTLVRLKNGGFGAHIVWDGLYDETDQDDAEHQARGGSGDCPYPTAADGNPVPADARGEPQYAGADPNPTCRYNDYKFDDSPDGSRERPSMFICIDEGSNDRQANPLVPFFANFGGLEGLEALDLLGDPTRLADPAFLASLTGIVPALIPDRDVSPHQCLTAYGETLPSLPPAEVASFTPSGNAQTPPDEEEVQAACEATPAPGQINHGAVNVDCPRLDQYNLFADPADPLSDPNGRGTPFDLNTRLFADYSRKRRVVFIPEGTSARYRSGADGANATYVFPVGTIIAKTFFFPDESNGTRQVVETRLLIKRANDSGQPRWAGLPYIWETTPSGERVARLRLGGGEAAVSWHYTNTGSGELHSGSSERYQIPHANQCVTCHGNDDRTAGSPPIGPKPRNLNKPFDYPDVGRMNQIAYWIDNGLLQGAPTPQTDTAGIATNIPRLPAFDDAADGGLESRVRAYLEVNCAHCHNPAGIASNTGLFLDALREVDASYGICKTPTAAGGGAGGREFDIVPGDANGSILPFRMNIAGNPEIQMPPISRSVIHTQGVAGVRDWIDNVVDDSYDNAESCGGGGLLDGLLRRAH